LSRTVAADAINPRPELADELTPGLYRTRWGVCELCSAALLASRAGDATSARRHAEAARAYFEGLEANGHVWHGLHYLRAGILAQSGDAGAALTSLERAVDLGWRRAWLMRMDPALEPIRANARFEELLARVDLATAGERAALVSPAQ
jgi:hypothetical protein